MRGAVLLSFYSLLASCSALHILDPETCSIPYIVPLAFQYECDRTDEFYHTDLEIESTDGEALYFSLPEPFIASIFVQRIPVKWTHEPFCLESLPAQNGYCVYTDSQFASGRGLSLIATPRMARTLVDNVPAFRDRHGTKLSPTQDGADRFHRKAMETGGYYVVANDTFTRGERVRSDVPAITMQAEGNALLAVSDQSLLLRVALSRLPPKERAKFLSQYVTPGEDEYYDRLEKNSFTTAIGEQEYAFISSIPEAAIYNHDCRPNLGYHFNSVTLAHEIYALRDIHPGEEMTVSYIPPYMNSTVRQARLSHQWGFQCKCKLCSASDAKKRASDRRLRIIAALIEDLNEPFDRREPHVKQALELVRLHEKEELWASIAGAHMNAAMEYTQLNDHTNALKWATMARDNLKMWTGTGHPYYTGTVKMIRDLERAISGAK